MNSDDKILYIFAYLLTWLSGIIVLFLNQGKNRNLRFHALQAFVLGVAITIISFFSIFSPFPLNIFVDLFAFLLWLYGVFVGYRAYNGVNIKIPVIGEIAESM
ncbi:MAG: hypothetical protein M1454_03325 [Candidatus Thermoplasmatota archaeon]|nr:hypothetical protein [Candidatus Thermoplasmatota archaeon]MCL5730565.1 hypothetical protein [Candidatus Thermoplasmatota archaeon]